jgi:hypothetical protein
MHFPIRLLIMVSHRGSMEWGLDGGCFEAEERASWEVGDIEKNRG